ncbi:hypothetical protein HU200_027732 [Digitaria exilis]|uniref:Uncharacterized protein n=1 Tax=Digitaria exilis TaxID=1010633 RepID=A0A835BWZ9_9POAL|nr:hypothetical protein HU200_027732 [Digitaria exilis]
MTAITHRSTPLPLATTPIMPRRRALIATTTTQRTLLLFTMAARQPLLLARTTKAGTALHLRLRRRSLSTIRPSLQLRPTMATRTPQRWLPSMPLTSQPALRVRTTMVATTTLQRGPQLPTSQPALRVRTTTVRLRRLR